MLLTEQTADGSLTCYEVELKEHYHNRAGAYTEALEHYAKPSGGAETLLATGKLSVLDVCFGLGYNTWVLLVELLEAIETAEELGFQAFEITVLGIENDPEILALVPSVLEDPRLTPLKNLSDLFEHNIYYRTLRCYSGNTINVVTKRGVFLKIPLQILGNDLRRVIPKLENDFDLVFHDPFSPAKMPELWTATLFQEYYRLLKNRQGRFLTYSTATAVVGGLEEAGFHPYRTQPLGAKQGGTLAAISPLEDVLASPEALYRPLAPAESARLQSRSGIPYRDCADFNTSREAMLRAREQEIEKSDRPKYKPE